MSLAVQRNPSTQQDLARVLCGWLVVVLVLHGLAASLVLVRGAAHRHVADGGQTAALLGQRLALGDVFVDEHADAHATAHTTAHTTAHARGTPHHHASVESLAVPADGSGSAIDAAMLVLVAALVSAMAVQAPGADGLRHALPAYATRWLPSHTPAAPDKPPRG